jgi:hypothetical protein
MQLQSGDIKSGTWSGTVNVPGNLMPGNYAMTISPLSDTVQNSMPARMRSSDMEL